MYIQAAEIKKDTIERSEHSIVFRPQKLFSLVLLCCQPFTEADQVLDIIRGQQSLVVLNGVSWEENNLFQDTVIAGVDGYLCARDQHGMCSVS